uniref:Lipoprotein n=1 Tax=Candidatus Kentrum sp. DK TaxID=2126562 RepID=A0A450TG48_9GAMM|nr:MAG: hypothetical protein BECKDK2373C_GA0170839_11435 [Candidatus Kentron sp. DK]
MVKDYVISVLFILVLSGCYDRFYGPTLRNGFNANIAVTISYANGAVSNANWPPCFEAFIGKTDRPEDVIQEIQISKEGTVIYRLEMEEVQHLLERERAYDGYSIWSIGSNGIQFETSSGPMCSKGKQK